MLAAAEKPRLKRCQQRENEESVRIYSLTLQDMLRNAFSSRPTVACFIDDFSRADSLLKCRYAVSVRWEQEQEERHRQLSDSSGPVTDNKPILTYSLEDFHRYFCCCARRVGSMFFLLETTDGSPIVVAGPCWPFCTFVTLPLVVVLSSLVGYFIVLNENSGLVSSAVF